MLLTNKQTNKQTDSNTLPTPTDSVSARNNNNEANYWSRQHKLFSHKFSHSQTMRSDCYLDSGPMRNAVFYAIAY